MTTSLTIEWECAVCGHTNVERLRPVRVMWYVCEECGYVTSDIDKEIEDAED